MAVVAPPVHVLTESQGPVSERLAYLDNLKTVLIVAIIVAHTAFSYVAATWALRSLSLTDLPYVTVSLILTVGVEFAMGTFFFMAGVLAAKSLAHRGFRTFVRERFLRLGVPYLVLIPIIWPVVSYWLNRIGSTGAGESLWSYWARSLVHLNSGALWFILVLLMYSLAYALWRELRPLTTRRGAPGPIDLVALAAGIGLTTFAIRVVLPLDSEQFLNLHLWQWPQCALMFWFGTVCGERAWLTQLPDRWWHRTGMISFIAVLAVTALLLLGGALGGHAAAFKGGWHWQSLIAAGLEGVLTVSATLWLLEYFRRRHNHQSTFAQRLTRCAYAAYLVQFGALVALGLVVRQLALSGLAAFLLVAPLAVVTSFAVAWLVVIRFKLALRIL